MSQKSSKSGLSQNFTICWFLEWTRNSDESVELCLQSSDGCDAKALHFIACPLLDRSNSQGMCQTTRQTESGFYSKILRLGASLSLSPSLFFSFRCLKNGSLIPALPNDVAHYCLAKVDRITLTKFRFVCKSWRDLCESEGFHDLRSQVYAKVLGERGQNNDA
jgi:hypothetical protein